MAITTTKKQVLERRARRAIRELGPEAEWADYHDFVFSEVWVDEWDLDTAMGIIDEALQTELDSTCNELPMAAYKMWA